MSDTLLIWFSHHAWSVLEFGENMLNLICQTAAVLLVFPFWFFKTKRSTFPTQRGDNQRETHDLKKKKKSLIFHQFHSFRLSSFSFGIH